MEDLDFRDCRRRFLNEISPWELIEFSKRKEKTKLHHQAVGEFYFCPRILPRYMCENKVQCFGF